jgi:hypothetical protein
MGKESFIIDYEVHFRDRVSESHTMIVKNCQGEMHAKIKLEKYLIKHNPDFIRLVVIKCKLDFMSQLGSIFGDVLK